MKGNERMAERNTAALEKTRGDWGRIERIRVLERGFVSCCEVLRGKKTNYFWNNRESPCPHVFEIEKVL